MTNPIETIAWWIDSTSELPVKSSTNGAAGRSDLVLVTVTTDEGSTFVGVDRFDHPSGTWEHMHSGVGATVTAWAPLPEPFNGFQ